MGTENEQPKTQVSGEQAEWLIALKKSPVLYANTSAISFNLADISVAYGQEFDGGEVNFPGIRIVMTHHNFMKNMEMLMPYYELFQRWYADKPPSLPPIENSEEANKLLALIEEIRGLKDAE